MKEINLEMHRDFLNSGKAEVIALHHSHIEGYFLKGEKLQVAGVIGSMIRVKTVKNATCLVGIDKVVLPDSHIETIHCQECKSLYKDKHTHNCSSVLVIL